MSNNNNNNHDHFPPSDDEVASRGSSVSTEFLDEYNQLLQYATILPSLNPNLQQAQEMEAQMVIEQEQLESTPGNKVGNDGLTKGLVENPSKSELIDRIRSVNSLSSLKGARIGRTESKKVVASKFHREVVKKEEEDFLILSDTKISSPRDEMVNLLPTKMRKETSNSNSDSLQYLDKMASEMRSLVSNEISQKLKNQANSYNIKISKLNQDFTEKLDTLLTTLATAENEIEDLNGKIDQKESIVDNLVVHLQKLKHDYHLRKVILKWKSLVAENKIEKFLEKIAVAHFNKKIMTKIFRTWNLSIQEERTERIKIHCKSKAEKILRLQEKSYNDRIDSMNKKIGELETENKMLKDKNVTFQKNLKTAFSRAQSALNLEVMKVLAGSKVGSDIDISQLEKMNLFGVELNSEENLQPFPSSKVPGQKKKVSKRTKNSIKKYEKTSERLTSDSRSKFWVEKL